MPETVEPEILLVEDNPHDAELCARALKKRQLGGKALHLKDGAEALDYIFRAGKFADHKGTHPKVIFLDLKLPKVDGLEVLKKLKSDERTRKTPIVMLTSSKEDRDVAESYALGVNSYIVKPMDFENFTETIAQIAVYWVTLNHLPQG